MPTYPLERLIREVADPDFGVLRLWALVSRGGPAGGPMKEIELRDWRSALGGFRLAVIAEGDGDGALEALEQVRVVVGKLPARERELRRDVAIRMIDLARDWAENAALTEAEFADALRINEVTVDPLGSGARVAIWMEDNGDIFHGHSIVAELTATGAINDVSLQG